MNPLLTVFTPTYNRAITLERTYNSLRNQTSKNFVWLIIDDGSTDNTKECVRRWIDQENEFEIRYIYKENGGLHTGYNKAIEVAETELMVCIDSDDYMPANAVELICNKWNKDGDNGLAGIIGLDYDLNHNLIGNTLPEYKTLNLVDVKIGKEYVYGDKKQVVRTELYKQVAPMKVFKGEKNFNPYYMILQISKEYDFLVLNEELCTVDYQKDGMTANQFNQYYSSPNSFAETRKLYLSLPGANMKFYMKEAIHYVSSCLIAKRNNLIKNSPRRVVTFFMYPFGVGLTIFIKIMVKNNIMYRKR